MFSVFHSCAITVLVQTFASKWGQNTVICLSLRHLYDAGFDSFICTKFSFKKERKTTLCQISMSFEGPNDLFCFSVPIFKNLCKSIYLQTSEQPSVDFGFASDWRLRLILLECWLRVFFFSSFGRFNVGWCVTLCHPVSEIYCQVGTKIRAQTRHPLPAALKPSIYFEGCLSFFQVGSLVSCEGQIKTPRPSS